MSPAPVKATNNEILAAARAIIMREGKDGLSLGAVAEAVGVRAPSLYKHFADRAALIDQVRESVFADLAILLNRVRRRRKGKAAIREMAMAFRAWAKREPHLYRLIYAGSTPSVSAGALTAVKPMVEEMTAIVGERHALSAARLFTAFLRGFVSMEAEGQFNMGGSVDAAFSFGVETILRGLD